MLKAGHTVLGRAGARLTRARRYAITLTLSKKARRALRRARTVRLVVVVSDAAGNRTTIARSVRLRATG